MNLHIQPEITGQKVVTALLQPLTPDQQAARKLLAGKQKHTCLVGGSRSGKTSLLVRTIVTRALRAPDSRHLMVRMHANALKASVWLDTFPKVMKMWFPGVEYVERFQTFFEFENGAQIWGGGLDDEKRVDKILGQEYATIYAGEVSQTPYSSILTLRTRLAQPGTGLKLRGYYDLNPTVTSHWSNIEFGEKKDPITRTALPDPDNFQRFFMNPEGNAANLDPDYIASLRSMPKKWRERFYEGKYVADVEGALWPIDLLEMCRIERIEPDYDGGKLNEFRRIIVGVDPSGAQSKHDIKSDEIGIVTCGLRYDGVAVVLEDATCRGSPREWGTAVVAQWNKWKADRVVAEKNYGGEMVRSTIQAVNHRVGVDLVSATRGKFIRAEPVAALYESSGDNAGKVKHAGRFDKLEEQMGWFSRQGFIGDTSPDRADALIWSLTALCLGEVSKYTLAHVR